MSLKYVSPYALNNAWKRSSSMTSLVSEKSHDSLVNVDLLASIEVSFFSKLKYFSRDSEKGLLTHLSLLETCKGIVHHYLFQNQTQVMSCL